MDSRMRGDAGRKVVGGIGGMRRMVERWKLDRPEVREPR